VRRRRVTRWAAIAGLLILPLLGVAAWSARMRMADRATLQIVQRDDETLAIGFTLERDRDLPDCEVVGPDVRATIDDLPLDANRRGEPTRARALGNGITIPPYGCDDVAWFTTAYLGSRPDGEVGVVRVLDGARTFEMRVLNLRALVRAELSASTAAPGDTVTMRIHPDGDPPLCEKGAHLSIFRGDKQAAVISDRDLHIRDRSVSFVVPRLEPGTHKLYLGVAEHPRTALRCRGASECVIGGYRAPNGVEITVR
jgi:hypothetical protein